MIRRPPRSTLSSSSAASDVYKRQVSTQSTGKFQCGAMIRVISERLVRPHHTRKVQQIMAGVESSVQRVPGLLEIELSLIHISEPTRLLSISYAVFCLKKKKKTDHQ
eukprot:TRINITY_DN1307_c0_g1_i2.p1 TRINITY_DN1307_c0_g1~~TRINITY_DN1307_c0_g1_i2.p1  ORF type:complete len:107 (+),score=43.03 TRINITY_DN1307_c0_g1_i2:133-453(+)